MIILENSDRGYSICIECQTPYPIKGYENKHLLGIFTLKEEHDRFYQACLLREKEILEAVQALENVKPSMARRRPSGKLARLLSDIQKSAGVFDS